MNPTSQSRTPKFDTGTLVVYGGTVYIVDHNRGEEACYLKHRAIDETFPVPERFLRTLKFSEFAWFRNPLTGHLMSGKTRGYMAIVIHLFTGLLFAGCIAQDATWWSAFALIPIVGYWIGTYFNYTGKWK